jgi:mRNA-degrading endonuclease RelE of RelBE toxin-antitoxin system
MREIEWTAKALDDMATLDKTVAGRVRSAERFAQKGAGDVAKLEGMTPPEYRLRAGDYRVRFQFQDQTIRILRVRNRREAYRR